MTLTLALATALYGAFAWIYAQRRFLFYFLFLLLVAWAWRFASTLYIDQAGPVFSTELVRDLGPGRSSVLLLLCYFVALAGVLFVFRPSRLRALASMTGHEPGSPAARLLQHVTTVVFAGALVWLALLFIDMLRIGIIPLFEGMERVIYNREHAGFLHKSFMEKGHRISFWLGVFYAARMHREGVPDSRFLYILLGTFVYLLLAGHRFSAFYANTAMFLIPWGLVVLRRTMGTLPTVAQRPATRVRIRVLQVGVGLVLIGFVSFAVLRSYVVTRQYGALARLAIEQRVLVQQGELWWGAYERLVMRGEWDQGYAFRSVFIEPYDNPHRNSTLPFLMFQEIGVRALPLIEGGQHFSGGYPEIVFELMGPWFALPAILALALIMAELLYLLMSAIAREQYITAFFALYIFHPFYLFHGSGMLNFLVNYKFWLKFAAFAAWTSFAAGRQISVRQLKPAEA